MRKSDIEEIHPLSYLQQALLIHKLKEEKDEGFIQVHCLLQGELELQSFVIAWEHVIDSHKALRTSIHWKNISKPIQVVHKKITPQIESEDISTYSAEEQKKYLDDYIEKDIKKGLDLQKAPMWRLSLFKVAENQHILLWSCHHILIDGWSSSIVIDHVLAYYEKVRLGSKPSNITIPSYFDYLKWEQKKDKRESKEFWSTFLEGIDSPSLISSGLKSALEGFESVYCDLSRRESELISAECERLKISLNVYFQSLVHCTCPIPGS